MTAPTTTITCGDILETLTGLPPASIHCAITSPPYWGLRDYGSATWEGGDPTCDHKVGRQTRTGFETCKQGTHPGSGCAGEIAQTCPKCGARRIDAQLGLEPTPAEYVTSMVKVFREVRRVLRPDGTLWLNMGDSYTSGNRKDYGPVDLERGDRNVVAANKPRPATPRDLKPKDLVGIPWRLAFALQADGWWLRQDIIWHKPNPLPESVRDRCTKAHEYLFLLTKAPKYYFDAEAIKEPSIKWKREGARRRTKHNGEGFDAAKERGRDNQCQVTETRNRRDVWTIPTFSYKGAHFATFPPRLVEPCILAGTSARGCCPLCGTPYTRTTHRTRRPTRPGLDTKIRAPKGWATEGEHTAIAWNRPREEIGNRDPGRHITTTETLGWLKTCSCTFEPIGDFHGDTRPITHASLDPIPCTVLDPFMGSGTVGVVAKQHNRSFVGIDLVPEYCDMATRRIEAVNRLEDPET